MQLTLQLLQSPLQSSQPLFNVFVLCESLDIIGVVDGGVDGGVDGVVDGVVDGGVDGIDGVVIVVFPKQQHVRMMRSVTRYGSMFAAGRRSSK